MRSIYFALNEEAGASRNHKGVFHAWGTAIEHTPNGVVVITKAIVEDVKTGRSYMVLPHQIKFEAGVLEDINVDITNIVRNYTMAEAKKAPLLRHINNYFKNHGV
ncbi:MAG: hypothetical protein E6Q97_35800 [Desulfurellales bacterium]|nr:MAG: hypothetical protein E6Q97_35800 [Desulfurellales bacterium]